jgi:DNA-binding transcriptional LysR family regulator
MDSLRPDLNLLVTFEALMAERNVTRAAARLHLSQPAVSAQLARLRDLFGDPLLIPARRGMTPTAKALALFEILRPSLDALRAGLAAHREFDPRKADLTVTIACSDYTQSVVIVPLAVRLRQAAPGVRLSLMTINPKDIARQLASGGVDLALLTPELTPPGVHRQELFRERYVLIGRRDHPRLKRRPSLADYLKLDHVMVSPEGGRFTSAVDAALAVQGLARKVVFSAASFLVVPDIVARSDFVALVPERLVRGRSELVCVREPPLPVRGFSIDMVWHERTHAHPGQHWLREAIAAEV